jgi:hypothetical protein
MEQSGCKGYTELEQPETTRIVWANSLQTLAVEGETMKSIEAELWVELSVIVGAVAAVWVWVS